MNLQNSEKKIIEDDLNLAIDQLISGCESLNMELAFEIFNDSPDFYMMGTGGNLCDYRTYLSDNFAYLGGCESFKLKTFNRVIHIIDKITAVFSWAYGVEAKQKTGEIDIIDNAGASFFFRKINNKWKVIYYHESSFPMKRIN